MHNYERGHVINPFSDHIIAPTTTIIQIKYKYCMLRVYEGHTCSSPCQSLDVSVLPL